MTNKRYICEQACQLGGKRYEVGEPLADGVEPNSHFRDTKTGEMVKAQKPEPVAVQNAEKALAVETGQQFEAYKNLVGEHLAKFDKRITALEKACAAKKGNAEVKAKGESKEKEPETQENQPEGKEDTLPKGDEQPDNPAKN